MCDKYANHQYTAYLYYKNKLEKVLFQNWQTLHTSNNHVDMRQKNFRQVQLCSIYGKYLFVVDIETNPLLKKKKKICLNYLYITHYSYCYTIAVPYQVVKVVSSYMACKNNMVQIMRYLSLPSHSYSFKRSYMHEENSEI